MRKRRRITHEVLHDCDLPIPPIIDVPVAIPSTTENLRFLRKALKTDENLRELITLYKCQTILLKFARECRESLHVLSRDRIRGFIWMDVQDLKNEAKSTRDREKKKTDSAVQNIKTQLHTYESHLINTELPFAKKFNKRKWTDRISSKLGDVVRESLLLELVELRMSLQYNEVANENTIPAVVRGAIRQEYEEPGMTEVDKLTKVLVDINVLLKRSENQKQISEFWFMFWDRISGIMENQFSARECQQHWQHNHHPKAILWKQHRWTKEDEMKILVGVQTGGDNKWKTIAADLDLGVFQVYRYFQTALNKQLTTEAWTQEDTQKLMLYAERYKDDRKCWWLKVSSHFPDKSPIQCQNRYEKVTKSTPKRGCWSAAEDIMLQAMVTLHGRGNWVKLVDSFPDRTDIKLRERYENMLAPELKKEDWTSSEDERLEALVKEHDPTKRNWSLISELLGGRTDAECAKRWLRLHPQDTAYQARLRINKDLFIPASHQTVKRTTRQLTASDFQVKECEVLVHMGSRLVPETPTTRDDKAKYTAQCRRFKHQMTTPFKQIQESLLLELAAPGHTIESIFKLRNDAVPRPFRPAVFRLALLKAYLNGLGERLQRSKKHMHRTIQLILLDRARKLGVPEDSPSIFPLTPFEKGVIERLINDSLTICDLYEDEGYICVRHQSAVMTNCEVSPSSSQSNKSAEVRFINYSAGNSSAASKSDAEEANSSDDHIQAPIAQSSELSDAGIIEATTLVGTPYPTQLTAPNSSTSFKKLNPRCSISSPEGIVLIQLLRSIQPEFDSEVYYSGDS